MAAFGTGLVNAQPAVVDAPVQAPPTDTVSSLNFSPAPSSNLLVATSWSGQVQCWDTALQGNSCASQPKAETKHDLPLDSSWFHDGSKVATCGCDKTVKVWDLQSNQQVQIGQHDAPVKSVCVVDPQIGGGNIVASGGWDKKLRYWDMRTQQSVGEVVLEEKVNAMDARERLLVVGTADQPAQAPGALMAPLQAGKPASDRIRKIYCFDLGNPTVPVKVEQSQLQYQTRCVAAFPGNAGYLVGSIEGRVGVQNFDGMHPDKQPSYTFKCHRRQLDVNGQLAQNKLSGRRDVYDEVHSINAICFHPAGTFMTAGSDGVYCMWDKDEKARLQKPNPPAHLPVTAASYNSAGSMAAYALGYDWGQGHEYYDPGNPQMRPQIMLHKLDEKEYQRRSKPKR